MCLSRNSESKHVGFIIVSVGTKISILYAHFIIRLETIFFLGNDQYYSDGMLQIKVVSSTDP